MHSIYKFVSHPNSEETTNKSNWKLTFPGAYTDHNIILRLTRGALDCGINIILYLLLPSERLYVQQKYNVHKFLCLFS